jgi:PleD family two-component response regulator
MMNMQLRAFELNAVDYLLKPFDEGRLRVRSGERVNASLNSEEASTRAATAGAPRDEGSENGRNACRSGMATASV